LIRKERLSASGRLIAIPTTTNPNLDFADAGSLPKPTWMLTEAECKSVVEKKGLRVLAATSNTNWLGTDDPGRDVVARPDLRFRFPCCCSASR